jgi:heat-inducible transcriptional repressor
MMTERQAKILAAVIEQYAELATPVGSVILAKLFGISPATVRAEMARLEEMGYLVQPHTSAGRIPTDKGYRVYVNSISENYEKLHEQNTRGYGDYLPEFSRKSQVLISRISAPERADQAIKNAVDSLVEMTRDFGFATIGDQLYLAGLGNLFSQPEFFASENARDVAKLIDQLEPWLKEAEPNQPLNVFIGSENPIGRETGVSLIISRFRSAFSDKSYIGVLGSTRQNYAKVMSLVAETGRILERNL